MKLAAKEELRDLLEELLLRLRCGESFSQAAGLMKRLQVEARVAQLWVRLRDRILAGQLAAVASVESFLEGLELEIRLERRLSQKATLPVFQAAALAACCLLLQAATFFLLPSNISCPAWVRLVSWILLAVGIFWIRFEVKRFRAELWFRDWLLFLARLQSALSWGQAFPSALHESLADLPEALAAWPSPLRQRVTADLAALRNGGLPPSLDPNAARATTLTAQADGAWTLLLGAYRRGHPQADIARRLGTAAGASFEARLERRAEALSLRLLAPLFVCFAPSMLLQLFAPFVGALG